MCSKEEKANDKGKEKEEVVSLCFKVRTTLEF